MFADSIKKVFDKVFNDLKDFKKSVRLISLRLKRYHKKKVSFNAVIFISHFLIFKVYFSFSVSMWEHVGIDNSLNRLGEPLK